MVRYYFTDYKRARTIGVVKAHSKDEAIKKIKAYYRDCADRINWNSLRIEVVRPSGDVAELYYGG